MSNFKIHDKPYILAKIDSTNHSKYMSRLKLIKGLFKFENSFKKSKKTTQTTETSLISINNNDIYNNYPFNLNTPKSNQPLIDSSLAKGRVNTNVKAHFTKFCHKKKPINFFLDQNNSNYIPQIPNIENSYLINERKSIKSINSIKSNETFMKISFSKENNNKPINKTQNLLSDNLISVQQSDLSKSNQYKKLIEYDFEKKKDIEELINKINTKFLQIIEEEKIMKLYEEENEAFLTANSRYLTQFEMNILKSEYESEEPDLEKIDKITKKIIFFAKFPKPVRYKLLKISKLIEKSPGEILFNQGDFGENLYVIIQGSVNVVINVKNRTGLISKQNVASIYDGGHFGELAMMGGTRKTKELIIDKIQSVITKNDINEFIIKENKERDIQNKKLKILELKEINSKFKEVKLQIEKIEKEINDDLQEHLKNAQKRLATISIQEHSFLLEIPRNEFKTILFGLYQNDFESKIKILSKMSFFHDTDASSLIPLANYLIVKRYKMGEILLREGEYLDGFYIIAKGRCKAIKEVILEGTTDMGGLPIKKTDSKKFNFSLSVQEQKEDNLKNNKKIKVVKKKINPENKIFEGEIIEENEEVKGNRRFLKFIEYKKFAESEFFGGRVLLSLDPILKNRIGSLESKLTVVVECNDTEVLKLPLGSFQFIPDYIRRILLRNLSILKEFDDHSIAKDVDELKEWNISKNLFCNKILDNLNKIKKNNEFKSLY